jgi:hypothetical protein
MLESTYFDNFLGCHHTTMRFIGKEMAAAVQLGTHDKRSKQAAEQASRAGINKYISRNMHYARTCQLSYITMWLPASNTMCINYGGLGPQTHDGGKLRRYAHFFDLFMQALGFLARLGHCSLSLKYRGGWSRVLHEESFSFIDIAYLSFF